MVRNQRTVRFPSQRRMSVWNIFYPLLCAVIFLVYGSATARALADEDQFIAGYACAILEREFRGAAVLVSVKEGILTVRSEKGENERDQTDLLAELSNIQGVVRVQFWEPGEKKALPEISVPSKTKAEKASAESNLEARNTVIFPKGRLFEHLIADPRWPHFSITYQGYIDDDELKNVGATSFGESFAFLRRDAPFGGKWELGIQAAVFAIFDLDAESLDLINADYWVGVPVSYRQGRFSSLFRIFHQSSHLGDEYLLRSRVDRVNLSYESIDIKASYELTEPLRVYGGGGFLFHRDPSDLAPWSTQCGLEVKSIRTFWCGKMRPVGGLDIQAWEETNWDADLCLRLGIQFEGSEETSRKIQAMIEYFNGHSPNGQFYGRTIEYLGFGTHLYF